jgi:hypothetical protein
MKDSKCVWPLAAIVIAACGFAVGGRAQSEAKPAEKGEGKPPVTTAGKVLMRDKLAYANKALDGLAVENFAKIAESAEMMRIISRASSWYVIQTDEYARLSRNFQEQASDMERHAKDKNLDAASLDYMRITLTCVQCHKYMRELRSKNRP